jgi:PPOX class probable F420-dependent enzyme
VGGATVAGREMNNFTLGADARLLGPAPAKPREDAMSVNMSPSERESFLAELHVGVLAVAAEDGRGPVTTPVWYGYEPGGVVIVTTGENSTKARAIAAAGRFSLCAQDEAPPYRYVTVEGPATIEPADLSERVAIARRYLGHEAGDAWIAANPAIDDVAIRMAPERWQTADFSKDEA